MDVFADANVAPTSTTGPRFWSVGLSQHCSTPGAQCQHRCEMRSPCADFEQQNSPNMQNRVTEFPNECEINPRVQLARLAPAQASLCAGLPDRTRKVIALRRADRQVVMPAARSRRRGQRPTCDKLLATDSPRDAPGDPSEPRRLPQSCRTIAQTSSNNYSWSRDSAQVRPKLADVCQQSAWPKVGQSRPALVKDIQHVTQT